MWSQIALVVDLLVICFVALNFLCWIVFKMAPRVFVPENERLKFEYFSRFGGELKPHIQAWFGIDAKDWPAFAKEIDEHILNATEYEDFTVYRQIPYMGRFVNISEHGYRSIGADRQGPWPIDCRNYNIFFFGGSTTLNVGPDWTSIPRYLQDELMAHHGTDRNICVYNFGRGAYFSTQEKILFQQLLGGGQVPNMVVFLDGVNDFYFCQGRTAAAGYFEHALASIHRENREARYHRTAGHLKLQALEQFMLSLPLFRITTFLADAIVKRNATAEEAPYRPIPVESETLTKVVDRYLENKRQIEAICRVYEIRSFFVWQPTPAYRYDLRHHIALNKHYGLGGHERSGAGYQIMANRLPQLSMGNNFLWLADMQEQEQRPLYVDNMHYASEFSHAIATRIADNIVVRIADLSDTTSPTPRQTF